MSWNTENEAYRCMVDTLVRMLIKGSTQYDIEKEVAKRAKDLDIESQLTFVTNFSYIIERLWYFNTSDKTLQDLTSRRTKHDKSAESKA